MRNSSVDALQDLLDASFEHWAVIGDVEQTRTDDRIHLVASNASSLVIYRAPNSMPFRWVIEINVRKRTAASVTGVLRIVRQALAPGYQPYHLTMVPLQDQPV